MKIDEVESVLALIEAASWAPTDAVEEGLRRLDPYFELVALESGIRRQMLEAVAVVESSVDPTAKNPTAPAYGLMQIWGPVWFGETLHLPNGPSVTLTRTNWQNPLENLRAGAAILHRYGANDPAVSWWNTLNRYNGDKPPRTPEYEDDVQARYLALLRRDLVRG